MRKAKVTFESRPLIHERMPKKRRAGSRKSTGRIRQHSVPLCLFETWRAGRFAYGQRNR